ncbi:MAG: PKD domain-containing protein [Bacteroidales bacterium]|nr:PKD domain-containing protein [Bacteroidales bacterium]
MRKTLSTFIIILTLGLSNNIFAQANCGAAEAIPLDVYGSCGDMFFTNVNFAGATTSSDLPAPTCGGFNTSTKDMWYSFTVPAGVSELAFHAFNAPPPILMMGPPACAPGMAVYRGSCGNLTLIDCFNADAGFMGMANGEIRWEILGVTPGETIYVRLWEKTNNETSLFFAASVITSLPEADCNNPPELASSGCNILAPGGTVQAPEACGWNTTDNVVFYSFDVLPTDPQPVVIEIEYGQCWSNESGGFLPENPEIQFAVYSWNGVNCNGIGGSPSSEPPNNATYFGCENGVGSVTYSQNLPPGQYVLAMDGFSNMSGNSLCTFGIAASFIDEDDDPPPITGELAVQLSTINNSCGQAGSATISINSSCSGSPTINWSNGETGTSITNLTEGNFSVTVSDVAPCSDTIINFTITDQSNFAVSITSVGNSCSGPVTLYANVIGANPSEVSFNWSNGTHTQSIIANNDGTYSVTATYGTCIDEASITIVQGDFDFSVNFTPIICAGGTGAAQFNLISGAGPFMYEWSTGSIAAGIQITSPGNYCLTATDMHSACQLVRCFTVQEVPSVDVNIETTDITCHNLNNGKVTAIASGGTPEYVYEWNGYIPGETMSNLISGNYSVIVTDANGCTGSASTFINNPPQFTYSISPNQGICFGEQAEISVIANGGIPPYTYTWSDEPSNNIATRIVSPENTSQYTVTVYDANHCTFPAQTTRIFVSQPINISVDIENVLCHGVCEGSAILDITGGIPPFIINWTSNEDSTISNTTDSWSNLCAGSYEVSLIDLYECEGSANFTITEPDTMYISTLSGPATCFGYTDGFVQVDATGGVPFTNEFGPFYQYEWSNGMTVDSLGTGFGYYYVTVTDANGCEHVAMAFVDQPEAIYVTTPWGGKICIGEPFSTHVAATGGLGPYEFVWHGSDGSTWYGDDLNVSPEVTTTYQVVTTDDRGCFGPIQTVQVKVHPPIKVDGITNSLDDICLGDYITVELEYQGGNGGPYTITLPNHGIVNAPYTFKPDSTGYYVFTVADDCGSPTDKDSIYVVVHKAPKVSFFADKTSSCPPGTFYFTNPNEEINNTFLWDFGDGGFSVEKDPKHTYGKTGNYTVSLTAWTEFGCKKTKTYNNLIRIFPEPRAEFTASPELVSILNAEITFENFTEGGTAYFWDYGDGETPDAWSENKSPRIYTYQSVGEFDITLIAKNQYECVDSIHKKIRVHDEYAFYAPDAFTPNGDGINDYFHVIGHGIDKKQFYMVIYDRFGMKVFETKIWDEDNPERMAWDGTYNGSYENGDKIMPNGMYRWYASFVDFTGKPHEKSGTVTLIR